MSDMPKRLVSLDAYRGLIMATLAGGGLGLMHTAKRMGYGPDDQVDTMVGHVWQSLAFHTSHPDWISHFYVIGFSYWDLIQPAFMFMVGMAMPFSFARRRAEGNSTRSVWGHAIKRAVILVLLGVFLMSKTATETNWVFINVLSQIGLGYLLVMLLLGRGIRTQLAVGAIVLVAYWLVFILYPGPPKDFDLASAGTSAQWIDHGSFAHFIKHANVAWAFDVWFLNLFPHSEPLVYYSSAGGYTTLNFIPSAVTMLMGVMAGQLAIGPRPDRQKVRLLLISGGVCMLLALAAGYTVCPIVKRIWTPSWTLFSGAWVLWMLAAFYWVIEVRGVKAWTFPLVVVGMNSIPIFLMASLLRPWITGTLKIHFGQTIFDGNYGPTIQSTLIFLVFWLICFWLYRQKIFIRI